jgi:hypothetical protein
MIRMFVHVNFIPAMLALIVFFTTLPFVESVLRLYARSIPAVEWYSVQVVSPIVRPGDILEIIYTVRVNRQCPSDLRGFLVAEDGSVPVRFPTVAGGYTEPSEEPHEVRVKIPIPRKADGALGPLEKGSYVYRTTATRYCPEGVEQDDDIPDAPFILEIFDGTPQN